MSEPTTTTGPDAVGINPPRFRLPANTRPGVVRLQVADLDRSLRYYAEVIGLQEIAGGVDAGPRRARLGARDSSDVLLELVERPGARAVSKRGQLGLYHFALLLPGRADLGRFVRHLHEHGVRFGASDHAVSEALYLTDPDGLQIEVYADRPRIAWRTRGRELVLTTLPLDLDALLEAAGEKQWNGVPAGSRIGHIHFHVGDLDAAEAFYHHGLGFDKVVWSYPAALFLSAGGYHHHVGVNTWAGGAPVATDEDARLLDWELVLPDRASLDAAAQSLERCGFQARPSTGAVRATDPWGITVRLVPA